MVKGPWGKGALFFLLLAGALAVLRVLAPEMETLTRLADAYLPRGPEGYALYVGGVALMICVAVPRQLLSFVGGYAFGAVEGALLATLGVTLGCVLAFALSRRFGQRPLERRFQDRLHRLNSHVTRSPFLLAMALRLFPSGNNLVFSLLAGASRIAAWPFFAGSLVGYVPQNIVFSLLGSGVRVDPLWRGGLSAVLFGLSCLFALWFYRRYRFELKQADVKNA